MVHLVYLRRQQLEHLPRYLYFLGDSGELVAAVEEERELTRRRDETRLDQIALRIGYGKVRIRRRRQT